MTTLIQPGLSSLIDRLFAEADAAEDARWPAAADDRADYRQYYGQLKDLLWTAEGPTSSSLSRDRHASLYVGAVRLRAEHRRVRDVVWHFDAPSCGRVAG